MLFTFDIETLPTDDESVIAEISKGIKPPGTIKKPESIAAWHDENGAQALADAVAKTSFDGMYGRIACISFAVGDDDPISVDSRRGESIMLLDFADYIEKYLSIRDPFVFCGHNLAGFDLPFLRARSIILGIKPPSIVMSAMNAKPWDRCVADTMLMWSIDREKRASMDKLCRAFGIEGKGDFDGSMVAETWKTDPQKVIEYCEDDVRRTREIYKRITFAN